MYVGSDAIALAPLTDRISYMDEGDFAVLTRESLEITDKNGKLVNREIRKIAFDSARVDKAGYKHFMAKEIAEQPSVLTNTLRNYISADDKNIELPSNNINLAKIERLTIVACGTAFYAALTAKYWFEKIVRIPVEVDVASEFRYREPPVTPGTTAIFVSQSGETADTLAALRYMALKGATVLSVVNVPESSIARESDLVLPSYAGIEIGVASTKAFTAQLTVLALLAVKTAHAKGVINDIQYQEFKSVIYS